MTDLTPRRFLTELYQGIDGHFTLFTIDRTTGQRNTAWATTPADLLLLAGAHPDDCCWFGVASRTRQLHGGQRGGAADCGQIGALWLDVDIAGPTHDKPGLPADRKQASDLIRSYPLKPTVVIDTGAGYQPWWFLAEPVDNPAALLARWGATWAELAHRKGFTIDNVFDVARIMRLPGTRNTKPDVNQLVTINAADYGRRYGIDDIDEHTLEPPPPTYLIRSQPYIGPGRVGDAFNDAVDAGQVLEKAGWTYAHTTQTDGSRHYTRPGKDKRQGSSATVYSDGHTIIWTDATSLKVRRSYDALGLYAFLFHDGQWTPAIAELARQGYGKQPTDFTAPDNETTTEDPSESHDVDVAVDGATFLLDEPVDMEARWGRGSEVLWAHGESLLLVGPPGVGKTTVAGQIIGALTGCWQSVLGYPMTPANRVLLLAMDRPRQVQRALRRAFGPEHRQHVHQHLIVRKGPLPADLGKKPELLYELALRYQADVIIIDSLKDAAVKITDDEVGGNVNRAIQTCNAHDIDVLALHHQRKGQGGEKPTSLEDVYGSTWITAGAGSVILLWGEAGSELVELTHLKQPSDPVGPFTVEHDHHAGTSTVAKGFDALAYLRMKDTAGATIAEAAQAEHGGPQKPGGDKWKKTERRLKGLVHDGYATTEGQSTESNGRFGTSRYYIKNAFGSVDMHRGQAPPNGSVDTTVDNRGQNDESPAHTVDTTVDNHSPTPTVDKSGGYISPDVRGVNLEETF